MVGLRYGAVLICGVLCGVAGAYLATALQAGFVKDMTAGRGFIALAALIFAKWRPWYALYACLLFGFLEAIKLRPDLIELALGDEGAGATAGCLAVYPDRCHPCWFCRQSHPPPRWRAGVCEGTVRSVFILT